MGLQDELNAHVKPQSRVCFKDGATPDKWDKVTTGYDQNAIRELGKHLHADISLNEDQKDGQTHSTADALLDGEKFKVAQRPPLDLPLSTPHHPHLAARSARVAGAEGGDPQADARHARGGRDAPPVLLAPRGQAHGRRL